MPYRLACGVTLEAAPNHVVRRTPAKEVAENLHPDDVEEDNGHLVNR